MSSIFWFLVSFRYRLINKVVNKFYYLVHGKQISIDWRAIKIINPKNVEFGKNFSSGLGAWFHAINDDSRVIIGDDVNISDYVHIAAVGKIVISSGCLIGSKVHITDHSHGNTDCLREISSVRPNIRALHTKGDVFVDENVWIGDNVVILGGVTIGRGSVIAANSVVNSNVPPYTIFGGIPAKIIKES